jgi:hypothetical protein
MKVRAKFTVTKVSELGYDGKRQEIMRQLPADPDLDRINKYKTTIYESTGIPVREITMGAVYGSSPEDRSFAQATPQGEITFRLDNPDLAEEFKPGQAYYVDFTRISEDEGAESLASCARELEIYAGILKETPVVERIDRDPLLYQRLTQISPGLREIAARLRKQ